MEQETIQHYDYHEFLSGYSMPSSEDLDLMEREEAEVPEEIKKDNRRFWISGVVALLSGIGIFLGTNIVALEELLPFFIVGGIVSMTGGLIRTFKRIFSKKTLSFPKLELRRKSERVGQSTIDALGVLPAQKRRLSKAETDKVIMGVCGGLGAHSGISSSLIRALFIAAFAFSGGAAVFIYLALAVFMPSQK